MDFGGPLRGAQGSQRALFDSLRGPTHSPEPEAPPQDREIFVRRVRKEGRPLLALRAVERGGQYVVEAEVFPDPGSAEVVRPGPYRFASGERGSAFVADALEALLYLGCEIETPEARADEHEPGLPAARAER